MAVIIDNIIMIGFGLSLLMGINHLVRREAVFRDRLFSFLFFSLAVTQLAMWNVNIDLTLKYPHLTELDQGVIFLFGPLLYLLYRDLVDSSFHFNRKYLWLFLPALAALVFLFPYYIESPEYKQEMALRIFDLSELKTIQLTFIFGILYCLSFSVIIARGFSLLYKKDLLSSSVAARIIVFIILISTVTVVLLLAGTAFKSFLLIKIAICALSTGLAIMVIANYQVPDLYLQVQETIQEVKDQKDLLKGINLDDVERKLKQKMEEEKIFLDDELTLESLGEAIGLSRHQLSQYLNLHRDKNFNTYVNEFRIEEAKRLIEENRERSAVSVAYAVGYTNYMTFQKVFKKITAMTPSMYKEKL